MSSKALWQQPYVNIFKHMRIEEWKKVNKEGDVTTYMDKTLKCSVFRIHGSIPASNYILLPKTSSQSLGLTGRYLYLLFRPSPNKHFIVHMDIAAEEGQVIRISFSNLFKEFKSTATWLQFPFLCGATEGSVYEKTASTAKQGLVGPAPPRPRWTCLVMDLRCVLSVYLNRTHSHLKSIKLCANMSVKNIITSDLLFDPGLTFMEFRQAGMVLAEGTAPMPREMCFPVPKGQSWHQLYDYIRFPSDGAKLPFDSIQKGSNAATKTKTPAEGTSPQRKQSPTVNISKPVQDRVSLIHQITTPKPARSAKQRPAIQTTNLPQVIYSPSEVSESPGSPGQRSQSDEEVRVVCADDDGVHVYPRFEDGACSNITDSEEEIAVINAESPGPISLRCDKAKQPQAVFQKMFPDPILKLNRIIGFGGATMRCAVWSSDGDEVVYPCHAIIVAMTVSSRHQRFFIGHTDKVSALALNATSTLLASAQTGSNSLIRLWSFREGVCQTIIPTQMHALHLLRQHCGSIECVIYSPDGQWLFSAGSLGHLVLYRVSQQDHHVVRVLGNVVAQGVNHGPDVLAVSSDSRCLALVGPTEYTVTIMEAQSLNELLRVDVSILDVESTTLDSALNVCFSPTSLSHLLIATSANKIIWINTQTGQLLRQVSKVHKHQCVSLAVSEDGRYLLTAGQNSVKVWDYNMHLDVNSQVFIGHSEAIRQVRFTPDQRGVVTVGDALFFWDFLAHPQEADGALSPPPRSPVISPYRSAQNTEGLNKITLANEKPQEGLLLSSSLPLINRSIERKDNEGFLRMCDSTAELQLNHTTGHTHSPPPKHASFLRVNEWVRDEDTPTTSTNQSPREGRTQVRPDCYKHFNPRFKTSELDQTLVAPPPGQAGLSLKAVIGYNGNGRNNMVWNPDTGLFVYSCGSIVIVEDLHTGSQKHWFGHTEEISTLAVTHDAQMVASASGGGASHNSLICIWNVSEGSCRNRLSYHKGAVQSLAFSRDDMYFLSLGDFSEAMVALWSSRSFELLCTVQMFVSLHDAAFCPFTADKLTLIGSDAVFFTRIQTHEHGTELQVQKVALPDQVEHAEVTSLCYNTRRILYTGTNSGQVCVWDCDTQRCFVTWEADEGEIGVLKCSGNKLITGSNTKKLRLWSVASVQNLINQNEKTSSAVHDGNGQVHLERELLLDGTVISAAFDDVMDMGIVGTTAGTLWYINWADSSSIRLISGHRTKVNSVVCSPDEHHFVTCGQDGSVRVWALQSHELLVQFQVLNQSCECVCWSPPRGVYEPGGRVCVAGGYSDGTVRIFSLESAEMELKLQPHPVAVCALQYSHYGHVLLSGGRDGLITVSSPVTGVSVRTFSDHKGAQITAMQCTSKQYKEFGLEGNELWLAVSADRRVSIWAADWTKNKCELLDWLTFPAPSPPEDLHPLPPSLAAFSPSEKGVVVYTGYAVEKEVIFYCLYKKQVLRTISLSDWSLCLALCSTGRLLAAGSNKRVLKLIHSSSGRFQDFSSHSDSVDVCSFSWSGSRLFTVAHNELLLWTVHGL
nr:WD repeat-containing protein 90 isoform X5 [Misgurnus anguillicaudatus]